MTKKGLVTFLINHYHKDLDIKLYPKSIVIQKCYLLKAEQFWASM